MVTHIKDNIYSIYVELPRSPLKYTNCYFIKGEGGRNLLIDTGFALDECRRDLKAGLSELGVAMAETDIFLTHLHADHSGLAAELAGDASEVIISKVDGDVIWSRNRGPVRDLRGRFLKEGFSEAELAQLMDSPSNQIGDVPFAHLSYIADGEKLEYGGHVLEAVSTPGHTPGHTCLYERKNKIMFLGDHVLFDITPNIVTWPGFDNSLKRYMESLQKIRGFDVDMPLPAHRTVSCTLDERIDTIIAHHHARLDEALRILNGQGGQTAYQIAGKMSWQIRARDWDDFPLRQKWFAVGEADAHLDYLIHEGLIVSELRDGVLYFSAADKS